MKKLGFALVGLVTLALIYYFITTGSTQVIENAKQQLDHELSTLQQSGFSVKERKGEAKEDHFVISFDDPEKIAQYLNAQGTEMKLEDARALQGLQIGVDARYLPDSMHALSLELYPVALPKRMREDLGVEDRKLIAHIETMLAKKAFLVHIDFDKMLSGFNGYIKDIDETVQDDNEKAHIVANGMTFEGDIKASRISTFSQQVALLSLDTGKELLRISNVDGTYIITGKTSYDATSRYRADSVVVKAEPAFSLLAEDIENNIETSVRDGLAKSIITSKVKHIEVEQDHHKRAIEDIALDLTIENLDIAAIEALQKTDPEDETRINDLMQQLFSKGIRLTLSTFSAKKIVDNGTKIDGFDINGSLAVDSSFSIAAASQNPFSALGALQIKTHISVSNELYTLIVQDPRAMLMMMMVPPETKGNRQVYDVDFSQGKLTVNGVSF